MTITIRPLQTNEDARAFDVLNRKWITKYFSVTDADEKVLRDPRGSIIDAGGAVLVAATEDNQIVGVIAVLATAPDVYELAKMTVDEAARGHGLGIKLVQAAVAWSRERDARLLFLGTNTALGSAIRVYESQGFEQTSLEDLGLTDYYSRANILMKLSLLNR